MAKIKRKSSANTSAKVVAQHVRQHLFQNVFQDMFQKMFQEFVPNCLKHIYSTWDIFMACPGSQNVTCLGLQHILIQDFGTGFGTHFGTGFGTHFGHDLELNIPNLLVQLFGAYTPSTNM